MPTNSITPVVKQEISPFEAAIQFDHFDIYILANRFTAPELYREVHHAEIQAKVDANFEGTPYADSKSFPWGDYAATCRAALECQKPKPSPAPAGRVGHIDIEAIKAKVDIVDIIGRYTPLRKSGHNRFTGRCPLHDDKSPSLTVYADKQTWHCFGACNTGGDVIKFTMLADNLDFKAACMTLGGGK
jgi:hypothetical protein